MAHNHYDDPYRRTHGFDRSAESKREQKIEEPTTWGSPAHERAHEIMTVALTAQFEKEVEQAMKDIIQPTIDTMIKNAAQDAVKAWSIQVTQHQSPDFFAETNVVVKFVEQITKTEILREPKIVVEGETIDVV